MSETKRHRLKRLRLDEVSLVDIGAEPNAIITIFKRGARDARDATHARTGGPDMDIEQLAEQMTAATEVIGKLKTDLEAEQAARQALLAEVEKLRAAPKSESGQGARPEANAEIAAELERLRKANEAAALRLARLDEREEVETFAKRARGYGMLPIHPNALGEILRKAHKAMGEDFAELERLLKAANAAIGDRVRGLGSRMEPAQGSAEAEITKAAQDLARDGKVSFAKAYQDVITARPDLYDRYLAERGDIQ